MGLVKFRVPSGVVGVVPVWAGVTWQVRIWRTGLGKSEAGEEGLSHPCVVDTWNSPSVPCLAI